MIEHRLVRASVRARNICNLTRLAMKPTLTFWPLAGPLKHAIVVPDALFAPVPGLRSTRRTKMIGTTWTAEYVEPRDTAAPSGAILYMHGGAFQFCGINTHRRLVHRLSAASALPVLSVDYRQHARGFFQDALDDCEAAFNRLVERGFSPSSIVLAGDSAGGMLAFALAQRLVAAGCRPAAVVGYSPWLDFDDAQKLIDPNAATEAMLPVGRLGHAARVATATPAGQAVDPALSPLNGDVRGLPPVLMYCASDEVLRIDAEQMAERLKAAGVPHSLIVWEGMVHAFPVLGHVLPESRAVIEETAAFATRVTRRLSAVADVA